MAWSPMPLRVPSPTAGAPTTTTTVPIWSAKGWLRPIAKAPLEWPSALGVRSRHDAAPPAKA